MSPNVRFSHDPRVEEAGVPVAYESDGGRSPPIVGVISHQDRLRLVPWWRRRAKGFGMEVIATDLYHDTAFAEQWEVELVELDVLLTRADFVLSDIFSL